VSAIDVPVIPGGTPIAVTRGGTTKPINVTAGTTGPPGPPGPPGPEGGTPVVAVPYDQWPPTHPLPDTLYLRLAP
jgi:hypothetical protein